MSFVRIPSCALAIAGALIAQSSQQIDIRGEVLSQSPILASNYVAELYSWNVHAVVSSTLVGTSGQFEFHGVSNGQYALRISTTRGEVLTTASVDTAFVRGPIELRLPQQKVERPISGTVSVGELSHSVPKKAVRAMNAAERYSQAGEIDSAVSELQKALRIDPEYANAHSNLGVQYVRLGRNQEAVEEFQEAMRLKPDSSVIYGNMASALLSMRRVPEAETSARRAVALDGQNFHAEYLLGRILMMRAQGRPEALRRLQHVETEMPQARLAVAQLQAWAGDTGAAVAELRQYLATNPTADRKQIESAIRQLTGPTAAASFK